METEVEGVQRLDATSDDYVGRWQQLVSTTNWEKGRIIFEWRGALRSAGATPLEFSDEAWSRRIGTVSPQHTGRLRRVFERFGNVRESYAGLYWSHFQVALDWHDAEMWLEGALHERWTISQMRASRAAALGTTATEPLPQDAPQWDEDSGTVDETLVEIRPVDPAPSDADDDGFSEQSAAFGHSAEAYESDVQLPAAPPAAATARPPFAELRPFPDDLAEAFENFKLCILRHKLAGWTKVCLDDVLASLEALRAMAIADA